MQLRLAAAYDEWLSVRRQVEQEGHTVRNSECVVRIDSASDLDTLCVGGALVSRTILGAVERALQDGGPQGIRLVRGSSISYASVAYYEKDGWTLISVQQYLGDAEVPPPDSRHDCCCDLQSLLMNGCRCGGK